MSNGRTSEPTVRDIFGALWRHKTKAILFACATLCVVAFYLVVAPKKYQSDAKLFYRVGRENVGLDPTVTTNQTMNVQTTRRHEINSAIEIVNSRTLLGKVVDILGADAIRAKPNEHTWVSDLRTRIKNLKQQIKQRVRPAEAPSVVKSDGRDDAITSLQKRLTVSSPRETTVINVACEATTPELAQKIVATLVGVYIGEHMRFNRTAGSLEFFTQQTELLRNKLAEANQELSEIKSGGEIVSIEGQLQLLEAQKSEIEQEQLRTDRQFASSDARYRALKGSIESLDEMVLTQRVAGTASAAADAMRHQLYALEIKERELLAKYDEQHPLLKAVRRQRQTVRSVLEGDTGAPELATIAVNPNWLELQLSSLQEASQLAALEGSRKSLGRQRTELAQKIKDLNIYAIQVTQLQWKADLMAESYKAYSDNLEQARIDAAIEDQRISNVSVIQEATLIRKPLGPQKKAIAALGLLVATLGGAGLACFCDYLDPRLKSPTEVEQVLELPVLISISRSARQRVCV